ncbi:DUF4430 domain-containing protein [Collinsella sp. zg1085]|uniref:DUF4430 domain-containing protein n=1 Tax=Collinsella sp. zg1085 TaxID=2844380 RepID=UPI001C0B0C53|nr:DUF4430 domain-containing protein [Collinsella sp. zg1085]QWT18190.1 DUF4430 domain-containing protein [Collinsella sp. zg1085]
MDTSMMSNQRSESRTLQRSKSISAEPEQLKEDTRIYPGHVPISSTKQVRQLRAPAVLALVSLCLLLAAGVLALTGTESLSTNALFAGSHQGLAARVYKDDSASFDTHEQSVNQTQQEQALRADGGEQASLDEGQSAPSTQKSSSGATDDDNKLASVSTGTSANSTDNVGTGVSDSGTNSTSGAGSSSSTSSGSSATSGSANLANNTSTTTSNTITVTVRVSAAAAGGGTLASKSLTFERGATAYDALVGTGLSVNASYTAFGIYVAAIGGYAEGEHGSESGWKYAVNGSEPSYSSGAYELKDGDTLSWYYVLSA